MYSLEHKTYMLVPVNLNPLVLHNDKLVKRITAPDRPTYVAMSLVVPGIMEATEIFVCSY